MSERLNNRFFLDLLPRLNDRNDKAAHDLFITSSITVAKRFVNHVSQKHNLGVTGYDRESYALDAVTTVYDRLMRGLVINGSYTGYLYRQCKHEVLHRTEAQKLELYCRENLINIMALSMEERQELKERMKKK